ncbi:hypothetical protein M409DRAFT_60421 [Zasmidium cellare ATCC 36951]|uniref:Uncharacterized protein n=1 Tax=Zasmidium cellare ATCC 36951 TaxID=1080233 RepID=A0A6A6C0M0_ZASCE|nr:uncharacterized protein M409DRAFT_60421 [Zasmidium cellare ATCC 36951]KAF2159818.1 hypothetical protein M409DRAFT_60421 [Zasmidium cellare ATCC 36951]
MDQQDNEGAGAIEARDGYEEVVLEAHDGRAANWSSDVAQIKLCLSLAQERAGAETLVGVRPVWTSNHVDIGSSPDSIGRVSESVMGSGCVSVAQRLSGSRGHRERPRLPHLSAGINTAAAAGRRSSVIGAGDFGWRTGGKSRRRSSRTRGCDGAAAGACSRSSREHWRVRHGAPWSSPGHELACSTGTALPLLLLRRISDLLARALKLAGGSLLGRCRATCTPNRQSWKVGVVAETETQSLKRVEAWGTAGGGFNARSLGLDQPGRRATQMTPSRARPRRGPRYAAAREKQTRTWHCMDPTAPKPILTSDAALPRPRRPPNRPFSDNGTAQIAVQADASTCARRRARHKAAEFSTKKRLACRCVARRHARETGRSASTQYGAALSHATLIGASPAYCLRASIKPSIGSWPHAILASGMPMDTITSPNRVRTQADPGCQSGCTSCRIDDGVLAQHH